MTIKEFLTYVPFVRNSVRLPGYKKNLKLAILVEVFCLLVLYVLLAPVVAMPLYNLVLFHPMSEDEDLSEYIKGIEADAHCKFRDVRFKAVDGESLHGWFFERKDASKVILVSHGNAGCMVHRLCLLPLLLQTGCSVFLYDYEGFGSSTGSPSLEKICDDAVAAFDFVTGELKEPSKDVIVYGESVGCGATSVLSTRRAVGAIILQSPFTSLRDVACDKLLFMKLYPEFAFPSQNLDNLSVMTGAHAPLLLMHGKKDDLLPCRYSERIFAEASEPKKLVLLPGAGHNDVYCKDLDLSMPALNDFVRGLSR